MTDQAETTVLVLQGGGALGAYQAGAYEALAIAGHRPNWVAGISIGAVNSAIIAGNPPEKRVERLREFWERVSSRLLAWPLAYDDNSRRIFNETSATLSAVGGVPGFFEPRVPPAVFQPQGTPEAISVYDTSPLKETLLELVDFDLLNSGAVRLSVGAVQVLSGNMKYFDTAKQIVGPEHIMASGALPPGFPPIEIDDEPYWDGGLVSNTPLQWVVAGDTRQDTLAFQVDLWSARGDLPSDLNDVSARQKEIQYSSRTRANTDHFKQLQCVRVALANVLEKIPREILESEDGRFLQSVTDRNVYQIVHLIYRSKNYEVQSKDYEFSRNSMIDHWNAGYNDAIRTLRHPEALQRPTDQTGVATFDVAVDGRE